MSKRGKRLARIGIVLGLAFGLLGSGSAFASAAPQTIAAQKVSEGEKALSKSIAAFAKIKSFSYDAKVTITADGQKIQTTVVGDQILSPKPAYKMTTSMTLMGQKMESSMIMVSDKLYMKMPGSSEWTVTEMEGLPSESSQADQMFDKEMLKIFEKITVKKVGNDQEISMTVNPKKYEALIGDAAESGMKFKKVSFKYTVDGKTSLPKKVTLNMEAEADGSTVKTDMVFTYKSFNKVKPIAAPSDAK